MTTSKEDSQGWYQNVWLPNRAINAVMAMQSVRPDLSRKQAVVACILRLLELDPEIKRLADIRAEERNH